MPKSRAASRRSRPILGGISRPSIPFRVGSIAGTRLDERISTVRRLGWIAWCITIFVALATARGAAAQWMPLNPVTSVQKQAGGVDFAMHSGTVRIQVCSDSIIHVIYSPTASFPSAPQYVVNKTSWAPTQWTMQATDKDVTIETPRMKITITRADGSILYSDATGKRLFKDYTRTLTPV